MNTKKILTIIYLNRSIALAKVSFSGKTANVSNYSEFALPDGTIENAIVYDPRTVSGIVKEYINAVGFKQIDKSVACIPDNKVKIIYYGYKAELSEAQNEEELTNIVESEMNTAMPQLSVLTDTYTSRGETQTIVYAIRKEILDPYITASRFGASIFPASVVLSQALSKNLTQPTIVLYPRGNSLRFFIWADGHVIANDVDGKNVLDIDNNLSFGIREIIGHGEKLIKQPIKKALFVEGKKVSEEDINEFMPEQTGFEVEFFRTKDAALDQYKFLALKGLIKKVNDTGLEKPSIKRKIGASVIPSKLSSNESSPSNRKKVALLVTLLTLFVIGLIGVSAWAWFNNNQRSQNGGLANNTNVTDTPIATVGPSPITRINLSQTPVITTTVVPTSVAPVNNATPATTKVHVLNGTETAGEGGRVTNILKSNGFITDAPGNKPPYNTAKTQVSYMPGFETMADKIIEILKGRYSLIEKVPATTQTYDIVVTIGAK